MDFKLDDIVDDWVASPPEVYFKFKQAVENPESSFKDFSVIIHSDPALSLRLLKIVNSPFYGFSSRIETIDHAMSIVGLDQLMEMILATTVMDSFKGIPKDIIKMEDFWRHGIACGLACQFIAKYRGETELDRFYVSGMLHDIGSLVIFKKAPAKAKLIIEKCLDSELSLTEIETEVLGFHHGQVGGALLKAWRLPARLIEVAVCHHHPEKAERYRVDAYVTHVADAIVRNMGMGLLGEPGGHSVDPVLLREVELSERQVSLLEKDIEDRIRDTMDMFLVSS